MKIGAAGIAAGIHPKRGIAQGMDQIYPVVLWEGCRTATTYHPDFVELEQQADAHAAP